MCQCNASCFAQSKQLRPQYTLELHDLMTANSRYQVLHGVKPGDQVILNPMVNLAEGSKVAMRSVRKTPTS